MIGNAITRGVALGLAAAVLVLACQSDMSQKRTSGPVPPQGPTDQMLEDWRKRNLIDDLWVQLRGFRAQVPGMDLDPPDPLKVQFRGKSVNEARRVCPEGHKPPKTTKCEDTCELAEHICDNAESICIIADELGKTDPSQEKCTSAKASCREAKQRCCDCKPDPNGNTPSNP